MPVDFGKTIQQTTLLIHYFITMSTANVYEVPDGQEQHKDEHVYEKYNAGTSKTKVSPRRIAELVLLGSISLSLVGIAVVIASTSGNSGQERSSTTVEQLTTQVEGLKQTVAEVKADVYSTTVEQLATQVEGLKQTVAEVKASRPVVSAFTVTEASTEPVPEDMPNILRFSNVTYDVSSDYDTTTGNFTCRYPGVYYFSATIGFSEDISCYLYMNDITVGTVVVSIMMARHTQASTSAIVHLNKGDTVAVGGCSGYMSTRSISSFTGFLITAD